MKTYLAVDIGASSGRHILGWLADGKMQLAEVYRFKNGAEHRNGHLCWDADGLKNHVLEGLRACAERVAPEQETPASVAIDTWGVDFVLLDEAMNRIGDAVAYRDGRTAGVPEKLEAVLPFAELYARTGIQQQVYNTVYQLWALRQEAPEQLERAAHFLMMPDYLGFVLSGVCANEYTIASTSALLNAREKTWDQEILRRIGVPARIFHPVRMAGEALGRLTPDVQSSVGFDTLVRLAPAHDTASAFLAVPARDENAVFLSSGTWSLIGVENPEPITTAESRAQNFTSEGGYQYRYRYLKNIMGLWMLQNIRRELGQTRFDFEMLAWLARSAADYPGRVDVNDGRFLAPENMQEAVRGLEKNTGKTFTSLNIVGGGSQDAYLNQLTADATGLPVYAGPTEGTAIGNLAVQMIADGALRDVQHARDVIRASFPIRVFTPREKE